MQSGKDRAGQAGQQNFQEVMNKFVIFDLDGTLLDSMGFWDGVGRDFLSGYGVTDFDEDFETRVKSMSVNQSSEYFIKKYGLGISVDFVAEAMRDIVADKYRFLAEFKKNAFETVKKLGESGVKMCIATATYASLVKEALTRLGAIDYFEFVLSCNDIGYGKDTPHIYYEAMKRLGGDKKNTVIVEDALHAIRTAKGDGFKVVAVEDRYQAEFKADIVSLSDAYLDVLDADTIMNI